jgi:hypothetical protein
MSHAGISYRAVLTDLQVRKAKIDAAISAIEDILSVVEPLQSEIDDLPDLPLDYDAPRHINRNPLPTPTGQYAEMTIAASAIHFLASMGKPQSTGIIAEALKRGGLASKSKNLYRTLYNTLNNRLDKEITKNGKKWGLKQWEQ